MPSIPKNLRHKKLTFTGVKTPKRLLSPRTRNIIMDELDAYATKCSLFSARLMLVALTDPKQLNPFVSLMQRRVWSAIGMPFEDEPRFNPYAIDRIVTVKRLPRSNGVSRVAIILPWTERYCTYPTALAEHIRECFVRRYEAFLRECEQIPEFTTAITK